MDHLRWMFLKISSHFDVPVIPTAWWMIIEGGLTYTPWKTTGDDRWYTKPAQSYFFPKRTSSYGLSIVHFSLNCWRLLGPAKNHEKSMCYILSTCINSGYISTITIANNGGPLVTKGHRGSFQWFTRPPWDPMAPGRFPWPYSARSWRPSSARS